jgi:hypothetical protein
MIPCFTDHDVAEVDADPKVEPIAVRQRGVAGAQLLLGLDRAPDRLDHARELGDHPVAPGVDHASGMALDQPRHAPRCCSSRTSAATSPISWL